MEQETAMPAPFGPGWKSAQVKKPKLLLLKSVNIVSKQSRQRAKATTYSKYERIRKGLALGWRMNTDRQGSWTARRMTADGYQFGVIGVSDEQTTPTNPADGVTVLDYDQAVAAAIEWDRKAATNTLGGPYRVAQAADDWLASLTGSEASKATARNNVEHWIKPSLGAFAVVNLTTPQLRRWLLDVANSPGKNNTKHYDANDPETKRKRRDTANRIFNDLAALLNLAFKNRDEITNDAQWRKVEKFSNAAKSKEEFLTEDEVQKVLNACDKDFRALVYAAIVTACRYNELATMTVANYNAANKSISLLQPKTQKVKHVFLNDSEAKLFDGLVKRKKPTDKVFTKADGSEWVKDDQRYRLRKALKAAGINRPVRFHDCRHTAASLLAAGKVDLAYISKHLGHSSQRVTERYRHLVESHLAETIRAAKPVFTTSPNDGD
jgi:integrase